MARVEGPRWGVGTIYGDSRQISFMISLRIAAVPKNPCSSARAIAAQVEIASLPISGGIDSPFSNECYTPLNGES